MNIENRVSKQLSMYLIDKLPAKDIRELEFMFEGVLSEYNITAKDTTALIEYDDNNYKLINWYCNEIFLKGLTEMTVKAYKNCITRFSDSVDKNLLKITSYDIKLYLSQYKANKQVTNTTLENNRLILNGFYKWLLKTKLIKDNPMDYIEKIKLDTIRERVLSNTEIEQIKNVNVSRRDKAIFEFLFSTACRVGGIVNAKINELNFDTKTIILHEKGGKDRIGYLTETCIYWLRRYLNERTDNSPYLFVSIIKDKNGLYHDITTKSVEIDISKLGKQAMLRRTHPHLIRATRITNLAEHKMTATSLQKIAGHSSLATTSIYIRSSDSTVKAEFDAVG